MTTGSKTLKIDSKRVADSIIMDKCNSLEMKHEIVICDLSNWIVDRFDSHNNIVAVLVAKGYNLCLKRDAKFYAGLFLKGKDGSIQNVWIY